VKEDSINRDLPKLKGGELRITERKISPNKAKRNSKKSPESSPKKTDPTQLVVEINPPVAAKQTKSKNGSMADEPSILSSQLASVQSPVPKIQVEGCQETEEGSKVSPFLNLNDS
jgi:hypothetical protein